jgi:hypothetical protein
MGIFGRPKPKPRSFFEVDIDEQDPLRAFKSRGVDLLSEASSAAPREKWYARRHRFLHNLFGLPLAILTGVSSGTALATTHRVLAGIIAGVAAILGAALSFLAPEGKGAYEQRKANDYDSLASELMTWLKVDLTQNTPEKKARERLADFQRRLDEINSRVFSAAGVTKP